MRGLLNDVESRPRGIMAAEEGKVGVLRDITLHVSALTPYHEKLNKLGLGFLFWR